MSVKISDREQWFLDRIGKTVWRNRTSCKCHVCDRVYKEGLHISEEMHAYYLCDMEAAANAEGVPLKYFDTKEERDQFEKELKK